MISGLMIMAQVFKPHGGNVIPDRMQGEGRDRLRVGRAIPAFLRPFARTTAKSRARPDATACQARPPCITGAPVLPRAAASPKVRKRVRRRGRDRAGGPSPPRG